MKFIQIFRHFFTSHFREFFVYHHSSLEFRAKLFAVVAGANEEFSPQEQEIIKAQASKIYDDPDRVETLLATVIEYIDIIKEDNGLGVDELAKDIDKSLKRNKRFVSKINTEQLLPLLEVQTDQDTQDYQRHIIDFLERLKKEHQTSEGV